MTCIVAVTDGESVVVGGDSAGVGNKELRLRADLKVFLVGGYAIGFTTSFRMGQILRHEADLPKPPSSIDPDDLERFLVKTFVPAIRESFAEHGFGKTARVNLKSEVTEEGQAIGGLFLVGVAGQIFEIREDFQVARPVAPFSAVGHGAQIALGALHALQDQDLSLRERATRALEAAEAYSSVVRRPFHFVEIHADDFDREKSER